MSISDIMGNGQTAQAFHEIAENDITCSDWAYYCMIFNEHVNTKSIFYLL